MTENKNNFLTAVFWAARLVMGGVFIYASLDKIIYPDRFAEIIYNYKILPVELVNLTAIILPVLEMAAGLAIIIGRPGLVSAIILTGLTLVFIAAVGYNLARGLDFQCGCFSTAAEARSAGLKTILRDLLLLIPAFICLKEFWTREQREI